MVILTHSLQCIVDFFVVENTRIAVQIVHTAGLQCYKVGCFPKYFLGVDYQMTICYTSKYKHIPLTKQLLLYYSQELR